jgi:hypothetical protein
MTRLRKTILLALAAAALAAGSALAAPDRTGSVTVSGPTYAWDGGPVTGAVATAEIGDAVPCDIPGKDCDDTLLNAATGQMTVKISSDDPNSADLDLYAYHSNAQGEQGAFVKSSTGPDASETVTFEAEAGPYLVRVVPATAAGGTFKGEAKELPLPPRAPDGGGPDFGNDPSLPPGSGGGAGGTTRATDLAPTTTARALKFSQSRVLRGTARDSDGKVAYVDVALVRLFSHSCKGLTATGSWRKLRKCSAPSFLRARGTTSWHYTLRKPLAKGLYVVFARATDNLGRREGGFGPKNRVRFRVT